MATAASNLVASFRASETWRPLANKTFRYLWFAALLSQIGNWMETVGAQWILVSQPNNETLVALVQTADTLPVMLLALPAGVLADAFDRRLLLIATQLFLAVVEVALAFLSAGNLITPGLLLLLTFLGGAGAGLSSPAWQALIPDVVDRANIRPAAVLGAVSVNVGRAIGPAIAGVLISVVGVAVIFGFNAASFLIFALVLPTSAFRAHGRVPSRALPARSAWRWRFVRWSPYTTSVLIRLALFLLPAMAIWALLPLVATELLHLDATGYGVLLGALGVGAILGVTCSRGSAPA